MPRKRLCGTAAVAVLLGAAAPAGAFTINVAGGKVGGHVSGIGDFRPGVDPSIAAASRVFGRPSSRELTTDNSCDVRWARLRLRITFANFGLPGPGQTVCSDRASNAQTFRVRGRRFRTWNGLRVGASEERILELHPRAEFRQGSWWLKKTISPFGAGDVEFAVVDAPLTRDARVRAIRGWIGAAGD
jgi:hypothetical protein